MKFLQLQRLSLFGAAAAAFGSVAVSGILPTWSLFTFAVAWLWGYQNRERSAVRWPTFGATLNLISLGILLILAVATLVHQVAFPQAIGLSALSLTANRLLMRRTPADDALLHLSCWVLLGTGALLSGELPYGFCLFLYTLLVTLSLTLAELRRGIEEEAPDQAVALLAAPELTSRRLLGFAMGLGLFALGFAAILFPLFPRVPAGLLKGLRLNGALTTGVSDRVDLTSHGSLQESSRLILRAKTDGRVGSSNLLRYWRAVTLDDFDGREWSAQREVGIRVGSVSSGRQPLVTGHFDLTPGSGRFLPIPEGLTALWPESTVDLRLRENGDLRLARGNGSFRFAAGAARLADAPLSSDNDLQLPPLTDEIRALAAQLIPKGMQPTGAARAVEDYFHGFEYTQELKGGPTPLEDFLRERRGHCQLFATAAVILLRARGIPARYVAGYYVRDPKPGEPILIRDWDAHAWAETIPEAGTDGALLVDATPPDERGGRPDQWHFWQGLLDLRDAAEFRWLVSVVNYDAARQAQQLHFVQQLWQVRATAHSFRLPPFPESCWALPSCCY